MAPPDGAVAPRLSIRSRLWRRARAHAVTRLPHEKVAAATSISQGSSRTKLSFEVRTSSNPPSSPPTRLTVPSRSSHARPRAISLRYATALATDAGHIANVEVAFAATG